MLKEKAKATDDTSELESIKKSIKEIEDMAKEAKKKTEEVEKEEQLRPWNVDTISKEGFSTTKINKPVPRKDENLTEEEREARMKDFVNKNKAGAKITQTSRICYKIPTLYYKIHCYLFHRLKSVRLAEQV